jgi:hypothetical protein
MKGDYSMDSVMSENNKSLDENRCVEFLGRKFRGISGSTVKIIAIITMLIDHTAATILEAIIMKQYNQQMADNIVDAAGYYPVFDSTLYKVYDIMRGIGRIGFPCFCFLLIEGFMYTRNRTKYAIRLALFAIISEVPFDLAFNQQVLEFTYQNVFFTLFIGLLTITVLDAIIHKTEWNKVLKIVLGIVVFAAGIALAIILKTDYDAIGVITITVMYFLRKNKNACMYGGCMALTIPMIQEAYAFLGMIPIAFYNGTRGLKMKYFFYIFYPAHLLILAGICKLFGLY